MSYKAKRVMKAIRHSPAAVMFFMQYMTRVCNYCEELSVLKLKDAVRQP
jgi:hypothetical protein